MADPEVKLKFLGNSADGERAIAILEKRLEKLEQGLQQVSKKGKKSGDDLESAFEKFGESILKSFGPLELVKKGIEVLRLEYENLMQFQDLAKNANVEFAQSLTNLALNTDQPLDKVKRRISELSAQARMAPADLANILNEAQAAKGHLDERSVDPTIIAASKLAKFDPESMLNLVGSSLSLQAQIPGSTPEQTIGFGLNAAAFSRVADAEKFSKYVLPAISSAYSIEKDDPKFLAALSAGITNATGDVSGERSRNAMLGLLLQMKAAFPEIEGAEARLKMLQDNPDVAKAFVEGGKTNEGKRLKGLEHEVTTEGGEVLRLSTDKATFRREMVPAIAMMTSKEESGAKLVFDKAMAEMPSLKDSDVAFQKRAAEMANDPNLKVAERENLFKIRQQQNLVENVDAAESSIMREGLDKTLQTLGYGWSMRQSSGFQRFFDEMGGMTSQEAALDVLKDLEIRERNAEMEGTLDPKRRHVPGKLTSLIRELNPSDKTLQDFAERDRAAGLQPSLRAGRAPALQPAMPEAPGEGNKATDEMAQFIEETKRNTDAIRENTRVIENKDRRNIDRNGNREN